MRRKETIEDCSPSGQGAEYTPRGGFLERWMLGRISSLTSGLPEEFEESGRAGTLNVSGINTEDYTNIEVIKELSLEGEGSVQFTEIDLAHSSVDSKSLVSLTADRYVTDDTAELHGLKSPQQTYELGAENNTLSLLRVMRSVSLAARTVDSARALEYLSSPDPTRAEASLPKIF